MFKYTKSLVTMALALTCSLSLVSCGGGGGGGGGAATEAPGNNNENAGGNTGGNESVKDLAPASMAGKNLSGSYLITVTDGTTSVDMTQNMEWSFNSAQSLTTNSLYGESTGSYTYTKTGANTARITFNTYMVRNTSATLTGTVNLTFTSATSASVTYEEHFTAANGRVSSNDFSFTGSIH